MLTSVHVDVDYRVYTHVGIGYVLDKNLQVLYEDLQVFHKSLQITP